MATSPLARYGVLPMSSNFASAAASSPPPRFGRRRQSPFRKGIWRPIDTIRRLEAGAAPGWIPRGFEGLKKGLDHYGVLIVDGSDGTGAGVRLKFTRSDVRQITRAEGEGTDWVPTTALKGYHSACAENAMGHCSGSIRRAEAYEAGRWAWESRPGLIIVALEGWALHRLDGRLERTVAFHLKAMVPSICAA